MTAPHTPYTFYITAQPQVDAEATNAARTAHDDWRINAEGTVGRAKIAGQVVWITRLTQGSTPTVYLTMEQATALGLCVYHFCGKPAEYVGFEGMRCGAHSKFGMSVLCSTPRCLNVSETGFSSHCKTHTTPAARAAREARQSELRAQEAARIGWQRVVGRAY
jgi:hypothetical protein